MPWSVSINAGCSIIVCIIPSMVPWKTYVHQNVPFNCLKCCISCRYLNTNKRVHGTVTLSVLHARSFLYSITSTENHECPSFSAHVTVWESKCFPVWQICSCQMAHRITNRNGLMFLSFEVPFDISLLTIIELYNTINNIHVTSVDQVISIVMTVPAAIPNLQFDLLIKTLPSISNNVLKSFQFAI